MENATTLACAEEVLPGHHRYAPCDDETRSAIDELESGGGTHCNSLEEMYRSLDGED